MPTDIQLALPWGSDAPIARAARRREAELADQVRRKDRTIYRLRRDLAESRALEQQLRRANDERERVILELERRVNAFRVRVEPIVTVDPARFGRERREG